MLRLLRRIVNIGCRLETKERAALKSEERTRAVEHHAKSKQGPGRTHRTRTGRGFDFGSKSKFQQKMLVWCPDYQKIVKRKHFVRGPILLYNLHWDFQLDSSSLKTLFLKFVSEGPLADFFHFCILC